MGKEKQEKQATYRSVPNQNRFWFHSEHCYTEDELNLRDWILKTRASSGIHADYLANPSSWFASDEHALINIYDRAWFYSDAYKPRHVLTPDDFHVQPVDNQRLQWPELYDLMQKVGDYLLLRNRELPAEHLNQPMNYVLLDINNILKGLSQNTNIDQVKEQLELLTRYMRTIEKNISPLVGSDRLFMANFRRTVEVKIQPQLTHLIESQLLKDRLGELSKTIKKISMDRNRILHFSLNSNPANPHPYDFVIDKIDDTSSYPTQAAKDCATQNSGELVAEPFPVLQLTSEQLKQCPHFKLITMDDEILGHYAKAISDLNELARFQNVISQTMDLLGQAGEVYTVYQFKEQMLNLLKQIEGFIDESSVHIEAVIQTNTQAYHKAIEQEQNLSFWRKWLTSEKEKLDVFIKNQDTLAQFPSSYSDLDKTNKALKGEVNQIIAHLSQPKDKENSFQAIAGQTQALDRLMGSMHHWIKIQHELKGLAAPEAPKLLTIPQMPLTGYTAPVPIAPADSAYMPVFQPIGSAPCNSDNEVCIPEHCRVTNPTQNNLGYLGLIALIPIGVIVLYLILQWGKKKEEPTFVISGSKEEFDELEVKFNDLLTQIRAFEDSEGLDLSKEYEEYLCIFNDLVKKSKSDFYDVQGLKEIYADLEYFFQENYPSDSDRVLCL